MKLVIAEKPSVAMSLSKVIGATKRQDGYLEGNGYLVSWCVGHLVELKIHCLAKLTLMIYMPMSVICSTDSLQPPDIHLTRRL